MRYDIESFEVPYARVKGRDLVLWVNKPQAKGNFPVFLDIHGGAWTHFDHKVDFVWCQELARRGFAVCSIDFRLAPDHPWPTFLCDVRAASRWVHAHGREIGADPSVMGAIGGSTGGHLSLLLGLQPNDPRGRVTPALDTPDDAPAGIDFVCANYPIVDVLARYQMVRSAKFDPLTRFASHLLENGHCTREELDAVERAATQEIDEAVVFAKQSPLPAPEETLDDVYA